MNSLFNRHDRGAPRHGNIAPASNVTRVLAAIEGICGCCCSASLNFLNIPASIAAEEQLAVERNLQVRFARQALRRSSAVPKAQDIGNEIIHVLGSDHEVGHGRMRCA
jgi:hypothetical protein